MLIEEKNEINVIDDYDVIVIGGGPAGVSAAISAGRLGVKTLLVEQSGNVGGVATTGLMSHWTGETKGGIFEEIISRTVDSKDPSLRNTINTEKLKTELLHMLVEANVTVKLYTLASKPIMKGNQVIGVIIENKSGRNAILGKYVIDCSGDGDIAFKAGVPFVKGRVEDGAMQPMTLMFRVGGVDYSKAVFPGTFEEDYELPSYGSLQQLAQRKLPAPAGHVLLYRSTLPGIVTCNMTNITGVDGTNADDLTKATLICRNQMSEIVDFLREFVPGFSNCFLLESADNIGVRETRHFEGEYELSERDIKESTTFADWIVENAYFNFDIHNISGSGLDSHGAQKYFPSKKSYMIPARSIIPKTISHLLLGGRNISASHVAHSNLRAMPICANIGQGSGILAALMVNQQITAGKINYDEVHAIIHGPSGRE